MQISVIPSEISKKLNHIKGIKITVSEERKGPSTGKPFKIEILSEELEKLKNINQKVGKIISKETNLYNISNSLNESKKIQTEIITDNTLLQLNDISAYQTYKSIATNVNGYEIGYYNQTNLDYKIKIFLQTPKEYQSLDYIKNKLFLNNKKQLKSLNNSFDIKTIEKENKISKINGFYSTIFQADIKNSSKLMTTTKKIINQIIQLGIINENQILLSNDLKDQKEQWVDLPISAKESV